MKHPLNDKLWANRSQQAIHNPKMIHPEFNTRLTKTVDQFVPVAIHRVNQNTTYHQPNNQTEYVVYDKATQARTGRWVLNAIAAQENRKMSIVTNNSWYIDPKQVSNKKHTFLSRKTSRVEPIEASSQFVHTKFDKKNKNKYDTDQKKNRLLNETIKKQATMRNDQPTPLSRFSSATEIHDIETLERSLASSPARSINDSEDCSTEKFRNGDGNTCISKRMLVIITVISILFIIGIFVGILVTIFVGRNNNSSQSSGKSLEIRSLAIPSSSAIEGHSLCPTPMFNVTDIFCKGESSYNYFSCLQMATSSLFTVRLSFQHDTMSGHWYFDDISVVQDKNVQLIINGGFESDLFSWILNIPPDSTKDTRVDTTSSLAHTGTSYLNGASTNDPTYIEQTFNVIPGEYVNISFWWKYDGGLKIGPTCQAIGELIPLL